MLHIDPFYKFIKVRLEETDGKLVIASGELSVGSIDAEELRNKLISSDYIGSDVYIGYSGKVEQIHTLDGVTIYDATNENSIIGKE